MALATTGLREFYVPTGDKLRKGSLRAANAMAIELLNYGIRVDDDLLSRIAHQKKKTARSICDQIVRSFTLGNLNPPLFNNWEQRTEFTFGEICVQILGYIVQLSGNDLEDQNFMAGLRDKVAYTGTMRLKLAEEDKALSRFLTLVNAKAALDRASLDDLVNLSEWYHGYAPEYIKSAEARMAVALGMWKSGVTLAEVTARVFQNPHDVLRYLAAVRDFDGVKLPSDVKYANVHWQQRLDLMRYLSSFTFEQLSESMGENRTAWSRFFRHFHMFQQPCFRALFPHVVVAGLVSIGSRSDHPLFKLTGLRPVLLANDGCIERTQSGNLAYRTFASRIQKSVEDKDFDQFRADIVRRPGYLFRNLGSLSHVCSRKTASDFVDLVRQLIDVPTTSNLLSLIQIDVDAEYRIIDSKGNTTVNEADYHPVIGEIQGLAEREIYRRHGFPGRVEVSDKLKNKVVPFLATNAELDRGTRIPFNDTKYLYCLMHWIQQSGRRTDLDLSFVAYDQDWGYKAVNYQRQANDYITHSGDLTAAPGPNGSTEYGRINLESVPTNVRYIVPFMNVYSGDVFSENEVAYAGFMFSHYPAFDLQRDHVRYDLNQPANSNVPFIVDMVEKEIIMLDFNNRLRDGMNVHSSVGELKKIISAVKSKKTVTIQRFAELLSGDEEDTVSLKITPKGKGDNKVAPADLIGLIT